MAESHYLYFWPMAINEGVVGHISLNVWHQEKNDQIYISHWPEQRTFFKRRKGQKNQQSLLEDIEAEGNRKPEVVQIPFNFLNPAKINEWLDIETKNPENPYNFFKWNCANVVCKALQIGLENPSYLLDLQQQFLGTRTIPLTPKEVFTWVQDKVHVYKIVKEQRPPSDSASAHLYPCAPLKPTENFSGRSAHLAEACEALKSPDKTLVVTAGTGGVGKTEFARKLAQDLSNVFNDRIFWMDSETQESLQKCLLDLSTHFKIPHDFKFETNLTMSEEKMKKLFHNIYSHFSTSNQSSLFIFDNANQFKPSLNSSSTENESVFLISDVLPNSFPHTTFSPCPAILITSRSSDWSESNDFQMIDLQNFTLKETLEYFKNSFPETSEEQLEQCQPEIELLHGRFDGYTLAFTLAAGWIRGAGFSKNLKEGIKCYIQLFQRPSNDLHGKVKSSSSANYKWSPHEIMEQICAVIGRDNPLALKLLKQMSFLSPDFLMVANFVILNEGCNTTHIEEAVRILKNFNVLGEIDTWFGSFREIKIHRVIQLLVGENQAKSKDTSILFEVCEKMLAKRVQLATAVPHLKSLICSLEVFSNSFSLSDFNKKFKCSSYIKQLQEKMKDVSKLDDIRSEGIIAKLKKLKPPIDPQSEMDNKDICLNASDEFFKITYQHLAESIFYQVIEKSEITNSQDEVLKLLGSLGIWPQQHLDQAVDWLKSSGDLEPKYQFLLFLLQHPRLTKNQLQHLEPLQAKLKVTRLSL